MNWFSSVLIWYFYLFSLGMIFYPLTRRIFGRLFFDQGYPFSKTIAILSLSYLTFFTGLIRLLPFRKISILLLIAFALLINGYIFKKTSKKKSLNWKIILFEEVLFLISLMGWAFIRGQEPSIRGLEKFMDFGFINSLLRAKYFPPLDMWLSASKSQPHGYPINYYYFGHLTGAFLIRLTNIKPSVGYNLILATIFASGVVQSFSLAANIIFLSTAKLKKYLSTAKLLAYGLLGSFIVNLGGNLHTIYAFTKGYPNEKPLPFWDKTVRYNLQELWTMLQNHHYNILDFFSSLTRSSRYWYPNATRFIPYTIHEFPSYSYVVADLHGHVFDIPFVLLTLAFLFAFFLKSRRNKSKTSQVKNSNLKKSLISRIRIITLNLPLGVNFNKFQLTSVILLGFLTAVHYMTNAFDGPIYFLLSLLVLLLIYGLSTNLLINIFILISSFFLFSLPFSINFKPFVSGIGVNCSPGFLVKIEKLGPFLFEKGNCQISPFWMLFLLWGFFWINFIIFGITKYLTQPVKNRTDIFILLLFSFGTFLIIIPEFFYIKDIYPAHFRANTMFKLGYQAFIMMGIVSPYVLFSTHSLSQWQKQAKFFLRSLFIIVFFFISIYPIFSIPSYYGKLNKPISLEGDRWLEAVYPEDKEIIDFLNRKIKGQPVIIEAQGDSYTDYERISAYTGFPTVAGWWVHEWLWRGSPEVVGKRIPDITNIYQSEDISQTIELLKKYQVKLIIVSQMERKKYPKLNEDKFEQIGTLIFRSTNGQGSVYQIY